jgi:predicted metal-dependent hydrolase
MQAVNTRQQHNTDINLRDGVTLPYRGGELPICRSDNGSVYFDGMKFFFPSFMLDRRIDIESRRAILDLYKRLALPIVQERVEYYSNAMGLKPASVRISGAAKRWGSCSGKGSLNFSWMLAAAHPAALDYVAVHELCHLRQHNHSDRFWKLVESILPDFKQRQQMLRQTERQLEELINK